MSDVLAELAKAVQNDSTLRRLAKRVARGDRDFEIVSEYSARVGEVFARVLGKQIEGVDIVTAEFAEALLRPSLAMNHGMIAEVVEAVQNSINDGIGIGLAPAIPALDSNRIDGLVTALSDTPYDVAVRLLGEPIVNYSQAIADQAVRDNADRLTRAGIDAWIVRKTEPHNTVNRVKRVRSKKGKVYTYNVSYEEPCRWCESLAGRFPYRDVRNSGNNIYRRHDFCRCTVTYEAGGKKQDVWSKAEWTDEDATASRRAIEAKERAMQQQAEQRAQNTQKRLSDIDRIQQKLGYSAKGASYFRNQNKDDIERLGIDYVIQRELNAR